MATDKIDLGQLTVEKYEEKITNDGSEVKTVHKVILENHSYKVTIVSELDLCNDLGLCPNKDFTITMVNPQSTIETFQEKKEEGKAINCADCGKSLTPDTQFNWNHDDDTTSILCESCFHVRRKDEKEERKKEREFEEHVEEAKEKGSRENPLLISAEAFNDTFDTLGGLKEDVVVEKNAKDKFLFAHAYSVEDPFKTAGDLAATVLFCQQLEEFSAGIRWTHIDTNLFNANQGDLNKEEPEPAPEEKPKKKSKPKPKSKKKGKGK